MRQILYRSNEAEGCKGVDTPSAKNCGKGDKHADDPLTAELKAKEFSSL